LAADAVGLLAGRDIGVWTRAVRAARPGARIVTPDPPTLAALDLYCRDAGLRHVGLLRMGAGDAVAVLHGAAGLLQRSRIDLIGFDGEPEAEAILALERHGYERVSPARPALLIHQRLRALLDGTGAMPDIAALCRENAIRPRGVIHIGAHEGQELAKYREMGLRDVLFIEANPRVFARLRARIGGEDGIVLVNRAITDRTGPVALRVTSHDQSSSLLKLRLHQEYYPTIVEEEVIEVPGTTLDALIAAQGLPSAAYNLLNIDIQGAELLALRGAEATLRQIDGINVEVNFEELYADCAQIEELDAFLDGRGFRRVATTCPFHRSWGDAFYVRARAVP
jgi:FkbM family methyltransferase